MGRVSLGDDVERLRGGDRLGSSRQEVEHVAPAHLCGVQDLDRHLRRGNETFAREMSEPLTLIKCDVEGHELCAFQGARELLRRSRPALLVEVSENPDEPETSGQRLFDLLTALGYRVYHCHGAGLRLRQRGVDSINYFFLQSQHLDRLEQRGIPVDTGS